MSRTILGILCASMLLTANGCGSQKGWEISVENQSAVPCTVLVIMGQDKQRSAKIENLAPKKSEIMIGEKPDNILRSIQVSNASGVQEKNAETNLTTGKIYKIVIDKDGNLQGSLHDQ